MESSTVASNLNFTEFSKQDLVNISEGFGPENFPFLPRNEMLMLDRITGIDPFGGKHGKGHISAEYDISPNKWFFDCHFKNDPIMPGSLGVDGLCQLLGFYLGWLGYQGKGRALGVGETKYLREIDRQTQCIRFSLDVKQIPATSSFHFAIADGKIFCDSKLATRVSRISVGLAAKD